MSLVPEDKARGLKVTVWKKYKEIAAKAEGREVGTCGGRSYTRRSGRVPWPESISVRCS